MFCHRQSPVGGEAPILRAAGLYGTKVTRHNLTRRKIVQPEKVRISLFGRVKEDGMG